MRVLSAVDRDPHDRQKRLQGWRQENIERARCLVAGAGALGNEVVKNLLQLGVRELSLVDYDTVVPANLNRTVFFTREDAEQGARKAEAVAARAKSSFPDARVTPVLKRVEELPEEFWGGFDYAFGCLDSIGARLHVNAQTYARGVPLIDGGTTGYLGRVQVARRPGACLECGLGRRDYELLWRRYACTGEGLDIVDPKMPALPTTTSVVAGLQAKEFVKLAHGQPSLAGRAAHYNGFEGTLRAYELSVRKDCPLHG
jgi:molybdopterin/thiamine biosynthesis adenylyltransferase